MQSLLGAVRDVNLKGSQRSLGYEKLQPSITGTRRGVVRHQPEEEFKSSVWWEVG